jgi:glycosyltransferase involved in cell wall biosynthesis
VDPSPQEPLITTILPTYRRPRLLRRALRSVLAQAYPHLQVCVFDNHSGDETAAVVHEFAAADPRVKYFCRTQNVGMVGNFAQAMDRVETPYFSFLSDDDFLLPDFYRTAMQGFEKCPRAGFSALLTLYVDDQCRPGRRQMLGWKAGIHLPPEGLSAFLKYGFLTWTAMIFRKDIIKSLGSLDTRLGKNIDTDFVLRAASRFPFAVCDQVGAAVVRHRGSQGFETRYDSVWPALTQILDRISNDENIVPEARQILRKSLAVWHQHVISRWCVQFTLLKDFESAERAARLMRELYGRKGAAFLLGAIPRVCRVFPPALWAGAGLNKVREALVQSRVDPARLPMADVQRMFHTDGQTDYTSEGMNRGPS